MREQDLVDGRVDPPLRRVRWRAAIRIIPSRYPPVDLFARVADPSEFEALFDVESLTNPRLRDERGEVPLMPDQERVRGAGASYIMAPFAHVNPAGGRFNEPTFGAFYAAHERATAVAETCYHRARFLAHTREPPLELDMRVLEARLDARLHDLRGYRAVLPRIHDPEDYVTSQRLARRLRTAGSWGIAFDSVRQQGGRCVAVFRPRALSDCRQAEHLIYIWDGARISNVLEKKLYAP
jgi:RES domain-containing protein